MAESKKDFIEILNLPEDEKNNLLKNKGLSAQTVVVPDVYKEIFFDNYKYFMLASGRLSGKTSILVALWWVTINSKPDKDIVVLQSTTTEIKDSIINEIEKFLKNSEFDVGDDPKCQYYIPRKKDRIEIKGRTGKTYFYPITDATGGQRTRGKATKSPVSLVMYEEAQKNKDANVVEQSILTFVRQIDKDAKFVIVGNNEAAGHWFVDYAASKKTDPTWCCIYANCFHIWDFLNDQTKEYIMSFKRANPVEFRRIFLGDIDAKTADVVFPQFDRSKHYKKRTELEEHTITLLIIGVDHATANDTFAIVPVAILDDGTAQTLEICYDDPQETNRSLSPSEQCDILEAFVDFLDKRYGIADNYLQTVISIDGAASPFIQQVRHTKNTAKNKRLWSAIKIKAFTQKKKDRNMGIIKNAFAYNVLKIMNEGLYMWDGERNTHRLAKEIEKQRYKKGRLDPSIPNDLCDALEYGLVPYYTNCYNLSFPVRRDAHYKDIQYSAGIK